MSKYLLFYFRAPTIASFYEDSPGMANLLENKDGKEGVAMATGGQDCVTYYTETVNSNLCLLKVWE